MTFEKSEMPWTLSYDEMDYVVEGEFTIKTGGRLYTMKPGMYSIFRKEPVSSSDRQVSARYFMSYIRQTGYRRTSKRSGKLLKIQFIKRPATATMNMLVRRSRSLMSQKPEEIRFEAVGLVQGPLADMVAACDVAEKTSGVLVEEIQGICPQHFAMIAFSAIHPQLLSP